VNEAYIDGTTTIVLNDLIRGMVGSTTNNPGFISSSIVFLPHISLDKSRNKKKER
jgi:hypothetical protein